MDIISINKIKMVIKYLIHQKRVEAINGTDIYLTIDSSIQRFVESAVKDINENIIMNGY